MPLLEKEKDRFHTSLEIRELDQYKVAENDADKEIFCNRSHDNSVVHHMQEVLGISSYRILVTRSRKDLLLLRIEECNCHS